MLVLKRAALAPRKGASRTCQLNVEPGGSHPHSRAPSITYYLERCSPQDTPSWEDGEAKVKDSGPQLDLGQGPGQPQPWRGASSLQEAATTRDTGTITMVTSQSQRTIWRERASRKTVPSWGRTGPECLTQGRWQPVRWCSVSLPPGIHSLVESPPLARGLDLMTSS